MIHVAIYNCRYQDKHNAEVSSSVIAELQHQVIHTQLLKSNVSMCVLCLQTSGDNFYFSEAVYRVFDGVRRSFTDEQPQKTDKGGSEQKEDNNTLYAESVHCMRMDIMYEFCIFSSTPVARST